MNKKSFFPLALSVLLAVALGPVRAQDLSKLASKTRDERLKLKMQKSVRVWTNDNLPKRPAGEGPTAAVGMSATPPSPAMSVTPPPTPTPIEPGEGPDEVSEASVIDSLRGRIKQIQQRVTASEEHQRLAEDELRLLQIQQATELAPGTQSELAGKIQAKTAAVDGHRQEIEKAKKEIEKLERELVASGGTLEEKK